jgi:hemerythrin-like domain-containing protein
MFLLGRFFVKRHPSLHPLSQHHHFVLIQALGMRRAAEAPAEKRGAAVQRQAEKFIAFWHKTGIVHFREEEEVLLPAYARHTRLDRDAEVMRLLADHAEIRAAVQDFEQRRAKKLPIGAEAMAHLAKLLHDHVRMEENEVFPRIERVLGEENLAAMGRGLTRLHSKNDACEI